MREGHWIRKKRGTWIIAVPPEVRRMLGVAHRRLLYWSVVRKGEAVLATARRRQPGRPPMRELARELANAQAEIAAIQQRDGLRDRGMYAEGFAHGYLQAYERLTAPGGPSAERGQRRARYRWAYPDAAYLVDPKQLGPQPAPSRPRVNARTRRAKRDAASSREVEVVPGPDTMPSPSPSPEVAVFAGEALAPGAAPPGQPIVT